MVNKKIYGLIFFLSIEIMIIGVLTFGNSFAYPDNAKKVWNVGYRVDSKNTNLIDINTTLEQDQTYEKEIEKADIVLFRTDWYRYAGEEKFFLHPYVSKEVGEYLLAHGIKTLAIDAINADKTGGTQFPIHDMYADNSGLIAENLAHFDEIDFSEPFVIFLPLKLVGVDGSPVRAVAVEFA